MKNMLLVLKAKKNGYAMSFILNIVAFLRSAAGIAGAVAIGVGSFIFTYIIRKNKSLSDENKTMESFIKHDNEESKITNSIREDQNKINASKRPDHDAINNWLRDSDIH